MSTYPKLVAELLRRGYTDEEASKVVGQNLITAMEKMEKVNKLFCCCCCFNFYKNYNNGFQQPIMIRLLMSLTISIYKILMI